MGEVIYVNFGAERKWEQTLETLTNYLVRIGSMFGDNEQLLRAKANCAHGMIRKIVEEVPALDLFVEIPDNLPQDQCNLIKETVRAAAYTGIEMAMMHSVEVLTNALYDLCTSKLAPGSRPINQ
jgi:hypothetical protein